MATFKIEQQLVQGKSRVKHTMEKTREALSPQLCYKHRLALNTAHPAQTETNSMYRGITWTELNYIFSWKAKQDYQGFFFPPPIYLRALKQRMPF